MGRSVFARFSARATDRASRAAFDAAAHAVAREHGVPVHDVLAPLAGAAACRCGRGSPADRLRALARDEATYLAVTVFNCSLRAAGRAAGMTAPPVLRALRRVEDRRDDPAVDRRLDDLELLLMGDF